MHWLNAPLLVVMIWSGLLIHWANDVYTIRIGGVTLFHFFPHWFYRSLHLEFRLAVGMAYHFTFMWFFAINGLCYVLYTLLSGEWRHLLPNRHTPREAWQVVLHDLGLRKTPPPPAKFNGAQQLAYTGVVLIGAGSLLTGLAIYRPIQFGWLSALLGGYAWARAEHFALVIGSVLFFVVHITQVIRAGWGNFRMASALHPQTLLCDTMNWQPLTREHGGPLRLALAVKYGYKSLKCVSLIRFQDERPPDYWAERGYDWYAGL